MELKEVKFKPIDGHPVHGSHLFCHVSPQYEGWSWYGCVGWLWDTAQKEFTGEGQGYKPQPPPGFISRDKFRLGVTSQKTKLAPSYYNALKLINLFEKEVKMRRTKLFRTQKDGCYLFEGNKAWVQSSFMISLFTNLIRLSEEIQVNSLQEFRTELTNQAKHHYWINDYFGNNYDKLHIIMKFRRDLQWGKFPYDPRENNSIHAYGIGALTSKQRQFYYEPAWNAVLKFRKKVENALSPVV